ncbi:MAG: OmpA family protein [Rhodospirillales bacterium]|nr:OmpA family protein [Rhodospirillales bacterium]
MRNLLLVIGLAVLLCGVAGPPAAAEDAALEITVTNGSDTGANADIRVQVRPVGQHNGDVIVSGGSGDSLRLPAGTYAVQVTYVDGAAHKTIWLDGFAVSGRVERTVDMAMPVAALKIVITNGGADLGGSGTFEVRPAGHHGGDVMAYEQSGGTVRVQAGTYDVDARFQDGADVGDKARIGIVPAGMHDEIGAIRGGGTAQLEAGQYELTATMPGAEGVLHSAPVADHAHLVVAMKPLRVAELKPGAPPPKECTIEVYGVNFDFNKSMLRADSEPVLQAVRKLSAANPSFRAEVGGHTDNIGTPDYNLHLSEARAAAVKGWLVAHHVAADRVTSHGYGDTRPLVANDTEANRFKNRRVELRRMNCH